MSRQESFGGPLLDGIRVIDLTTFLSGPFATQMLADMGADVIKVEAPGGDSSRAIPPHFVGEDSAYFLTNNRGKRSAAIDMKQEEGVRAVIALIRSADIVIENFRPGVAQRLGLHSDRLREEVPGLIWVSISGFGQSGPWREKPAYDMIVQALSGVMSLTGEAGRPAMRLGIPAGDLVAGMYAAHGALGALVRRGRTGEGALIDVSMLDGQLTMLSYQAVYAMLSGSTPSPQGARHDSIPTYRSFRGGDGREFVVTANTERMWVELCDAVGRSDLPRDARFASASNRLTHREALWKELEPAMLERSAADWVALLEERRVPAALIKTVPEALEDAKRHGRGMVVELDAGDGRCVEVVGNPVKVIGAEQDSAGHGPRPPRYPPALGADGREVLADIGYSPEAIDDLEQRGVLVYGQRAG
ncbi:CaiB/BaiF CoA-transferase family protein [Gulosibacter sp. 10]|uniref:CaiB/BaiF CoA transferase family protein n=1 Tax=Gulosibacter sp. 10 TaxID=1255570 RepID=UPI00097EAD36|nr:CoA transferase [Gulosibacter sp. 10]SJM51133.1 L-carnitine dehydratase [Gulosibacter sp. 10]